MTPQPSTTLSHKFIAGLDGQRDRLYALAVAACGGAAGPGAAGKIEALLQSLIREVFPGFEKDPQSDPATAVEKAIQARSPGGAPAAGADTAMPADLWARLVATVQVEAARSVHSRAINPDSVLLSPDPLLAPKKSAGPDGAVRFDLSPSSRFVLAAGIAVLVGVGLTIYLLTRTPGASTRPAPATAGASGALEATTAATMPAHAP